MAEATTALVADGDKEYNSGSGILGDTDSSGAGPVSTPSDTGFEDVGDSGQNGVCDRAFTLFPKLPPELRIRIWKFSLPGTSSSGNDKLFTNSNILIAETRFIEVRNVGNVSFEAKSSKVLGAKPPANFSACRESRSEALPLYKPFQIFPGPSSPTVFLNPDMDILCLAHFKGGANGQIWRSFERQNICFRRIALWDSGFLAMCLGRFWDDGNHLENLKELIFLNNRWEKKEEIRCLVVKDEEDWWVNACIRTVYMIYRGLRGEYPEMRAPLIREASLL